MEIVVAERRFFVEEADGTRHEVCLSVGRPEKVADMTWTCAARLDGLPGNRRDTIGVDSWQALTVAIAVTRQALAHLVERGARLYAADGEEIGLDDLFPHFD